MADLLAQLLSLAAAGTMMISTGLNAGAPQNDIDGTLFLQNRQWRASSAFVPETREAEIPGKVREMRAEAHEPADQRDDHLHRDGCELRLFHQI